MGEIFGALCIVLAVVVYAARARALGRELREFDERMSEKHGEPVEAPDGELAARDLARRHNLFRCEDLGGIDFSGIEGLGS